MIGVVGVGGIVILSSVGGRMVLLVVVVFGWVR